VLGAARGAAEESTFRRAFALVSPDVLDRVLGAWLHTRAVRAGGRLVIAVDGKAVRGAKGKGGKAPHLVAALAHGIGAVLGQVAVTAKSNEIPAVRDLLKAFADLAGTVITIDALHTQSDTAQVILARQADYVMTVEGQHADAAPAAEEGAVVPRPRRLVRDPGPRPPGPPHDQGGAGAGLDRVRRRRPGRPAAPHGHEEGEEDRRGRLPHHQRPRRQPATLASWVRGHREIENKLHWVRDVTYQEDKSLVRTGNAPRVMASLRSLAISILRLDGHANIAAANRHHARDPQRTLKLLQAA
jgi:predicted transposase YbfD/YdcC